MNSFDPKNFVEHWIASWNVKDIEAVLSHYRDDVRFYSPIAMQVVGKPCLEGKDVLASYWYDAMEKYVELNFKVEEFTWVPERKLLSIYYIAKLNGADRKVCESQWLDDEGKVVEASAYYGAEL